MDLTLVGLDELAEMANKAAGACRDSARRTVKQAAICGRALIAAKAQCEHGQWMHWLRQNFDYDTSTARRYMDVANCASVHNLADHDSVASVLRVLADERAAERTAANPEPAWTEPADMPPSEPPAAPKTIVDHKATQTPAEQPQASQAPVQATQQPAEPIEPEIVREASVLVFRRRQMLRVGRLYILTPEGFDEVES